MQYLTPKQICEKIGLRYTTVLEWAKEGRLPARIVPSGKKSKYFFVEKEVFEAIEKFKVKPI